MTIVTRHFDIETRSTQERIIDRWLRENGGARKFEPGFSVEYANLKKYLEDCGIILTLQGSYPARQCFTGSASSRPKRCAGPVEGA